MGPPLLLVMFVGAIYAHYGDLPMLRRMLTGVASVVVQMLVPYAATLAADDQRSEVIGTLMGGLLIGILLSRTFAGLLAQAGGWRTVYRSRR